MKLKGYLLAAGAAAAYGTIPLFALNLYAEGMNANSVLLFRYLLGLPILALMLWTRGRSLRVSATELKPLAVLGFLMAISSLTLFESYNYINSGVASTLLFVYPIMVALLMVFFFHEKFAVSTGICLVVMALGLLLLMRNGDGGGLNAYGFLLVMLSSLTYALYIVMINVSKVVRTIPTLVQLFYVLAFGSVVFMCMIPFGNTLTLPHKAVQYLNLLALALIPTVISLSCTTMAIQHIGPTITAIFGALEPVTAVLLSTFVLSQSISEREILGAALILASTMLVIAGSPLDHALLRVRKMFPSLRKRK